MTIANQNKNMYIYKERYKKKNKENCLFSEMKIYDSSHILPKINKVFVFDLDETIGCFTELYVLWRYIFRHSVVKNNNMCFYLHNIRADVLQNIFNGLLDLYPEFLRYNILSILEFIYQNMCAGKCGRIYIYTNNQCEYPGWVKYIIKYLDMKISGGENSLFEKPICAFKINNIIIENKRTSANKSYYDFIRCSLLPKSTEVCFIDDKYYAKMAHDKVYYIQPPPYYHHLKHEIIYERFMRSGLLRDLIKNNYTSIHENTYFPFQYNETLVKHVLTKEENKQIYIKMLFYMREFLNTHSKRNKTRKNINKLGRFTRKNVHHISDSSI